MTCENCGDAMQRNPDADDEYRRRGFPENAETVSVCDECYDAFNLWWAALPQSERDRIEAERLVHES